MTLANHLLLVHVRTVWALSRVRVILDGQEMDRWEIASVSKDMNSS